MPKIVYNACYGGFSLSKEAEELYFKKSGLTVYPMTDKWCTYWFMEEPNGRTLDQMFKDKVKDIYTRYLDRHDPVLVKVVEELGSKKASGDCAKLQIHETEASSYKIDEYDGFESVVTKDTDSGWVNI